MPTFDAHVHLRQLGHLAELVTPHISKGGINTVYVMPNTIPPITTTDQALNYQSQLKSLSPQTEFLMSLYLTSNLTIQELQKAKKAGIIGVKSYPKGVTTNSNEGIIESYETYYEIFSTMENLGLILNLHGEVPSNPSDGTCVMNAESRFLPQLVKLHKKFPNLKIVLEHATTRSAIEVVKNCGPTIGCSITPHHLTLIVDDWAGNNLNFCKPVAKFQDDREALREVIREGHPRFFLGSDSAPHPINFKLPLLNQNHQDDNNIFFTGHCSPGIYTSAYLLPILATIFESALPPPPPNFNNNNDEEQEERIITSPIPLERLKDFISKFGRSFYGLNNSSQNFNNNNQQQQLLEKKKKNVRLIKTSDQEPFSIIPYKLQSLDNNDSQVVIPFWAGRKLSWKIDTTT
ncbi:hypothetical protein CROQUDRAFT_49520 [Cronartium quercuum f. sp. fusiforme G11]|uniref:Dihydroorotase n=1 Tax=Cronartium quercuum f. sp. fusiforme G11 TaxID=708437 RepID=A0A9P6NG06_9BASI|nr:hypothetical protein CROQUDRAFT_49520 [Cronartium quercuum f. sp. fusiforme G11]